MEEKIILSRYLWMGPKIKLEMSLIPSNKEQGEQHINVVIKQATLKYSASFLNFLSGL